MIGTVLEEVGDKACHVATLSINPNAATGLCSVLLSCMHLLALFIEHMFSTAKAPLHSSHKGCPIQWPHRLEILWWLLFGHVWTL